jgi:hypothetical protein
MDAVADWVQTCMEYGPPDDSRPVDGYPDLYTANVPLSRVVASFLAIMQDRCMIVKRFR